MSPPDLRISAFALHRSPGHPINQSGSDVVNSRVHPNDKYVIIALTAIHVAVGARPQLVNA